MLSEVRPILPSVAAQSILNHPCCKILKNRAQYRACHIRVPDSDDRLAAIVVNDRYHSFFKLIKEEQKALSTAAKLVGRGDEVVMTSTVKGVAIWIYEADAWEAKAVKQQTGSQRWQILMSKQEYQLCEIRVPDVAEPIAAICLNERYYSLVRTLQEELQAIELAERFLSKGHSAIITCSDRSASFQGNCGYEVWVLESDVTLCT